LVIVYEGEQVAVGVGVGVNVAVAVGVGVKVAVAVGVGGTVAVAVAVGVGLGEPAGQAPGWERTMLSILQPEFVPLVSLPMRQRSTTFCPAAAGGRFTVVVIKPLELAPHA